MITVTDKIATCLPTVRTKRVPHRRNLSMQITARCLVFTLAIFISRINFQTQWNDNHTRETSAHAMLSFLLASLGVAFIVFEFHVIL